MNKTFQCSDNCDPPPPNDNNSNEKYSCLHLYIYHFPFGYFTSVPFIIWEVLLAIACGFLTS